MEVSKRVCCGGWRKGISCLCCLIEMPSRERTCGHAKPLGASDETDETDGAAEG